MITTFGGIPIESADSFRSGVADDSFYDFAGAMAFVEEYARSYRAKLRGSKAPVAETVRT